MQSDSVVQRFARHERWSLVERLCLRSGTLADYQRLSAHHYRAGRPATATRVLVLEHSQPDAFARFTGRRCASTVVGVLVESLPSLSCTMRDWALRDRYGGWLRPKQRATALNDELRCISRVVVHPQWRGLGLAVRLVRASLGKPATIFTEALAAMGQVHPFFERSGMTPYRRPAHRHDARLAAALSKLGFSTHALALLDSFEQRIESLSADHKAFLLHELHQWYRKSAGRSAVHSADPAVHLRLARNRLLFEPVYYLHDNRATITQNIDRNTSHVNR